MRKKIKSIWIMIKFNFQNILIQDNKSILDYQLNKSFKKSIVNSGGFANNADKKRSYVVYPNGLKKQTRSFLFIKKYPKIIPGSELVVPIKQEKEYRYQ